jgi:flagellar protein FlgJ
MSFTPPPLDPTLLRKGVAGKISDSYPVASAAAPDDGVDPAYRAKATEAAVKFESFFIGNMLHKMRDSTRALAADDSPSKDRINDDMLDMADNLVADQLAGKRAFGVADAILRQLLPRNPAPAAAPAVAATQNVAAALNSGK